MPRHIANRNAADARLGASRLRYPLADHATVPIKFDHSVRPLRILMVLHMPWERKFGGARVQLELAEEFQKMGHHVMKFDYHDAFPCGSSSKLQKLFPQNFSKRAALFVREHAHDFDVIDAHQTNLPFSKSALGFRGLLLARSVGLVPFYDEFRRFEAKKWKKKKTLKSAVHTLIERRSRIRTFRSAIRSFQTADLITVPNLDEYRYVSEKLGLGEKCRVLPFGLTELRLQKFTAERRPPAERQRKKQVVFIGAWGNRKGSRDWKAIIYGVRQAIPTASFLFLGTGCQAERVLADLELPPCEWIRVVPSFSSDDLPLLMAPGTVGALPSYIEGFPFAVLENLAAGLPTVTYDVPGPRAMLTRLNRNLMVVPGDVDAFAASLVSLLSLPIERYASLSCECHNITQRYRWCEIASQTLQFYRQGMERISS